MYMRFKLILPNLIITSDNYNILKADETVESSNEHQEHQFANQAI